MLMFLTSLYKFQVARLMLVVGGFMALKEARDRVRIQGMEIAMKTSVRFIEPTRDTDDGEVIVNNGDDDGVDVD